MHIFIGGSVGELPGTYFSKDIGEPFADLVLFVKGDDPRLSSKLSTRQWNRGCQPQPAANRRDNEALNSQAMGSSPPAKRPPQSFDIISS
jgi:hypothetical protein